MTKRKRFNPYTPWFPADVKPVRPGVYEVRNGQITAYRMFSGGDWYLGGATPKIAEQSFTIIRKKVPFADHCRGYGEWRGYSKNYRLV